MSEHNVLPGMTYFARGCFLAGTGIQTPDGIKLIETLKPGDKVISYNEKTGAQEVSTIGAIDVLEKPAHYVINGSVRVTGEHPFYTNNGIVEVQNFDSTHRLVNFEGHTVPVSGYTRVDGLVTVYNLLDVVPNHNYYANDFLVHNKGGGCFLAGTQITTPEGTVNVEDIKAGDKVISFNEKTHRKNTSTVERLDVLQANAYYTINYKIRVTGEHPFYTLDGIKQVQELKVGDTLLTDGDDELVTSIERTDEFVDIYNLINVDPNHNYYADGYLVHNKGGGGGRGGFSGGSRSSSSGSKSSISSKPAKGTSTAKPGSKIKTSSGKTIQSSAKKPTNSKFTSEKGIVGDNGYSPRFTSGYKAPEGSVVYYRDNSLSDYFFWAYLFNADNPARPENMQATVVQPDNKEVIVKPEPGGVDGMMILNWIVLVALVLAVIAGIIWGVNKATSKDKPKSSYGYY